MNILGKMKRIPGGLIMVPLIGSALLNTFFPEFVQIGEPVTSLFSSKGTMVLVGLVLFISGTQLKISEILPMLKRSGVLCMFKLLIVYLSGMILNRYFGLEGVFGLSSLVIITTLSSSNPGLYAALTGVYGDESDASGFAMLNIISAPAIPIMILSSTMGYGIDISSIIATIIPFVLGILLGNLDKDIRKVYSLGRCMLLPFMGICFGSNINMVTALKCFMSGSILTIIYYMIILLPLLFVDKFILKRPGYAASAMSEAAGLSLAVPALARELNEVYKPFVEISTAQIAFVVIATTIITPYITRAIMNRTRRGN